MTIFTEAALDFIDSEEELKASGIFVEKNDEGTTIFLPEGWSSTEHETSKVMKSIFDEKGRRRATYSPMHFQLHHRFSIVSRYDNANDIVIVSVIDTVTNEVVVERKCDAEFLMEEELSCYSVIKTLMAEKFPDFEKASAYWNESELESK